MCAECGYNPCHRMCPNFDEENDTFEALEYKQEMEFLWEQELLKELKEYEKCN